MVYIPQLFYKRSNSGELEALSVKVVDDVLLAGNIELLRRVIKEISNRYEIVTIVYIPGVFLFNVRSIGSAETIAVSIAIDEGTILSMSIRDLLNVETKLRICVDSKDLCVSLTTCHEPTDKFVILISVMNGKNVNWQ